MTANPLADRVAALEAKVGHKTIAEQFREQAELIDRLFIYRFDEFDKKWDAKLDTRFAAFEEKLNARLVGLETSLEERLEAKLETKLESKLETKLEAKLETKLEAKLESKLEAKLESKLEAKLEPIRNDLAAVKDAAKVILARLP
ncbi:MAG: hypothetical protein EHM55_12120 [Acidobacteria bacterium]|nr:MAG: hypothetical protein EHM55_12120 [Acidobacteriota bacterium]